MPSRTSLIAAALCALVCAPRAMGGDLVCIEVGTVWTGAGESFSPGCVLVRDGKILHVGDVATVGANVQRIAYPKGFLMPAITDAHTYLNVRDEADRNEATLPICPDFRIADCLTASTLKGVALYEEGVLATYVSPGPRQLVAGRGAVIDLGAEAVLAGLLTMCVSQEALSTDRAPVSRAGLGLMLREQVPQAVAGATTLRIFADAPNEAEQALAFARGQKAKAVLVGCLRPELLADVEGAAEAVVVVRPTVTPTQLARLAQASRKGVRIAFASWAESAWEVNLRFLAALAHRYGMPRDAVLRGLTTYAAEACERTCVLAAGAPSEFVIFDGDALDLSAPLVMVYAKNGIRYRAEGGAKP
jgi:imidazolonepropionase-like amidohydrolase